MKINFSLLLKALALGVVIYLIVRVYQFVKAGSALTDALKGALTTSPLTRVEQIGSTGFNAGETAGNTVYGWGKSFGTWIGNMF